MLCVQEALDISIYIVEGKEETLLIHGAIHHLLHEHNNYLHVDVGRVITEVSLYTESHKIAFHSFDLGSQKLHT